MVSDRISRVIDNLFEQVEEAARDRDWDSVQDLTNRILGTEGILQDAIQDAHRFLQLAEGRSREESPVRIATRAGPVPGAESAMRAGPHGGAGSGGTFRTASRLSEEGAVVAVSPQLLELFYSYAKADEELRIKLMAHLAALKRTSRWRLDEWHRGMVDPGQSQVSESRRHIESAKIILLLVSPEFMRDLADDPEVIRALERAADGEAIVVPVRLKPVTLPDDHEFLQFTWLPSETTAISTSEDEDSAMAAVAEGIKRVCAALADVRKTQVGDTGVQRVFRSG